MTEKYMVEVLPAILEKSFGPIQDKINRLRGKVARAQLDIGDGIFIPEESWREPERLAELGEEVKLDLHLMVDKPEQWINHWSQPNVWRITFHQEATYDVRRTLELVRQAGQEVGVALKLETPASVLYDILDEVDMVLLLAVVPGRQGQEFDARVIAKVEELRRQSQDVVIGVDGGVTPLVASSLVEAGANVLVSGSYFWEQEDVGEAIESLQVEQR